MKSHKFEHTGNFVQDLINLNPDVIDCQNTRHPDTFVVAILKGKGLLPNTKFFVTTHGELEYSGRYPFYKEPFIRLFDMLITRRVLPIKSVKQRFKEKDYNGLFVSAVLYFPSLLAGFFWEELLIRGYRLLIREEK